VVIAIPGAEPRSGINIPDPHHQVIVMLSVLDRHRFDADPDPDPVLHLLENQNFQFTFNIFGATDVKILIFWTVY
jgi:hypothetical protein